MEETQNNIKETVNNLCKWINERLEKGSSSEELKVLPEVISATTKMYEAL